MEETQTVVYLADGYSYVPATAEVVIMVILVAMSMHAQTIASGVVERNKWSCSSSPFKTHFDHLRVSINHYTKTLKIIEMISLSCLKREMELNPQACQGAVSNWQVLQQAQEVHSASLILHCTSPASGHQAINPWIVRAELCKRRIPFGKDLDVKIFIA